MGRPYVRDINILTQTEFTPPLLLFDSFDVLPFRWTVQDGGLQVATAAQSTAIAHDGGACAVITPTNAASNDASYLLRNAPVPRNNFISLSFFAYNTVDTLRGRVGFAMDYAGLLASYYFFLALDQTSNSIVLSYDAATWAVVSILNNGPEKQSWMLFQCVINLATGKFSSFSLNNEPVNLSAITLTNGGADLARRLNCGGLVATTDANLDPIAYDSWNLQEA